MRCSSKCWTTIHSDGVYLGRFHTTLFGALSIYGLGDWPMDRLAAIRAIPGY